ncbi:MAG: tyrosine--tRNA ligase [Janthinobacterium lividum]
MARSEFLQEARSRGFVFQCTDEAALDEALVAGRVSGYAGFDCTADSLHVGHLLPIMLLRLMQRTGHRPVVVLGGGTTRIGDPSFREEARRLLDDAQIAVNMAGIKQCFEPFVGFSSQDGSGGAGPVGDALLVNNAEWLDRLGYIELLREVGTHVSVNRMLSFDSVRTRLEREQGLTFLEFNYSILQSYDFRELSRKHDVTLQLGGSDQWGNIVSGVELVRRTDQRQVFGLTTPLIATASGAKMGKTASGAVWLRADRRSAYEYWQFWRNTEDGDVGRFLRLFTDVALGEIARLEALGGAEVNEAKKVLATEATRLLHGEAAAGEAAEVARRAFETGEAADLPEHRVEAAQLEAGVPLFRVLVESGLAASNGEARRLVRGGGARLNDVAMTDEAYLVTAADLRDGAAKLSAGRKQHRMLRVG